jgi:glycosyltransferase involved in cell wall biosynthesis
MLSVIEQTLHRGRRAARALELDLFRAEQARHPVPVVPDSEVIVDFDTYGEAEVTVVIPLYNYAHYVTEALDSVAEQTVEMLDLVVVDDCSTDDSVDVVRTWIKENRKRFSRVVLRRNVRNSGLGLTRNAGFAAAETPFVMPLDADNKLIMHCLERCLPAIRETGAAFVYPSLQEFGDSFDVFSNEPYDPIKFAAGNFIDATALIRLSAWGAVGGYDHVQFGWEDYDLWCRFAERGMYGHHVDEVLVQYRVHRGSMLHTTTDGAANKQRLIANMQRRHSWILRNMGLEKM